MTDRGVVNWRRAEILFGFLGDYQIDIFRNDWAQEIDKFLDPHKMVNEKSVKKGFHFKGAMVDAAHNESYEDVIRVYNKAKFKSNDPSKKREIMRKYMDMMQWGLQYYYQGTKNWRTFYPFHYAPLLSDMVDLTSVLDGQETIEDLGEAPPYLPFMGHLLFFKLNSIRNIMPKQYLKMAETQFQGLFNKNGKFDLNGATIWHKVVVINQIKDAEKMMMAEEEMLLINPLTQE